MEKSTLERSVDNQSFSHPQSIKIKFRKSGVKVVRDLLTKKWIFVKRDKQLSVLAEVARLLKLLSLPP
jgi:hypothetical protein